MAEASVQPVPCVCRVAIRGSAKRRIPSRQQQLRHGVHVRLVGDGPACQHLRLGDVRRDDRRQGQEPALERLDRLRLQQRLAPFGDHHRVRHQGPARRARGQLVAHRLYGGGVVQHAGLDGVAAEIVQHGSDLAADEARLHPHHVLDAQRVLRRQRRHRRHGEAA
jgi:hypothetical protein